MFDFQEKHQVKRLLYSKISILVLLIMIGLLTKGLFGLYPKYESAQVGYQAAANTLASLEERTRVLEGKIGDLATERGVETVVRETYPVAKPGEEVIIIVPEVETSDRATTSDKKSWWSKIWQ